jgi:uncharacterized protein YdeI (YjbR/CyaY-like superfamily)
MNNPKDNLPILGFKTQAAFEKWLAKNHSASTGMWLKIYKKGSGTPTVSYAQAVDAALCYGWIDGLLNPVDEKAYIIRFTPRRSKSIWSKKNIEKISRLMNEGKMKPAGLKEIEKAKADGRWEQAYDPPSNIKIPDDFLKALSKLPEARKFFQTLNKANTYAIAWRLQTAKKPETREKRMKIILEMLDKGEKFH